MNYALYEDLIVQRAVYFFILCALILIASIVAVVFIYKRVKDQKVLAWLLNSLCAVAIIGSVWLGCDVLFASLHDVKNRAYICWQGEFVVDKDVENLSGTCSLILSDKNETRLETDAYILNAGKYTGKVIYGEKTEVVLDVQVD